MSSYSILVFKDLCLTFSYTNFSKNNVVFCNYFKNWKIKTFSQINLALKYYPNEL